MNSAAMHLFRKLQPTFSRSLMSANAAPGWIRENLCATTRTTVESGRDQTINNFLVGHSANARQMIQLHHCESFQVHIRKIAFEFLQQRCVVIELQPRMQTAYDMKLASAFLVCLPRDVHALVHRPFVSFRMAHASIE